MRQHQTDWGEPLCAFLSSGFGCVAKSSFRRADGVLLLYDVTCEKSFLNVREWVDMIEVRNTNRGTKKLCGKVVTGCLGKCCFSSLSEGSRPWGRNGCEMRGSQWHLAVLVNSSVAGQVPTEPSTLLTWASGGKPPGLSYRWNQNPTSSKWKFRQPKKEQQLFKRRVMGLVCSATGDVTGLPHMPEV